MLFQELQEGDTLVVTKLDRFARTTIDGVSAVRELFNRGVRVHILNMGLIENTLTGNLILTVMLAFAEYERGMIVNAPKLGKPLPVRIPTSVRADRRSTQIVSCIMQLSFSKAERATSMRMP